LAEFKADVLNKFVADHVIRSLIEFGCGDGNQLLLARYPEYVGLDVSPTAVKRCQELFKHDAAKRFAVIGTDRGDHGHADLVLSLDVIYHLVEDEVYERYMHGLFDAADRFVVIYSDNEDSPTEDLHVRHRRFTDWIENNRPNWQMVEHIPNQLPSRPDHDRGSWSDFWIFANSESNYIRDTR
jgi:trans-aconitate methyltransferase